MRQALIMLVLMCGCAQTFNVPTQQVGPYKVEFVHPVTKDELSFSLFAIRYIADAWESDFGFAPYVETILIDHRPSIFLKGRGVTLDLGFTELTLPGKGRRVRGVFYRAQSLIKVCAGRYGTLPSLYHEFCHASAPNAAMDGDHTDPRWDGWDDRAWDLNRELVSAWYDR